MYYVTFYGDANDSVQVNKTEISIFIRAIDNGGSYSWAKEKDLSSSEERRIETRFEKEITAKFEFYTNTKSKFSILINPADCSIPIFDTTEIHSKAATAFALSG